MQKIRSTKNSFQSGILALFLIVASTSSVSLCEEPITGDEALEHYLKLIDESFENDELKKAIIAAEKERMKYNIIVRNSGSDKINTGSVEDPEDHYFKPKQPKLLTPEEKKIPLEARIAKKYIGDIPTQVDDIIGYLSTHEKQVKWKVPVYNRVLLHGKPGVGKSHFVNVIAQELQLPLLSFNASFFADKYIGETSRRIRKAFAVAKAYNKPIIIFIDELDALALKRTDNTHNEHRAALLTLLTEIQDLKANYNVIVFTATNDLEALDSALIDRFSGSVCEIKELTQEQRALLFQKALRDHGRTMDDAYAKRLAEVTEVSIYDPKKKTYSNNFSNRDVEYIITSALTKEHVDCARNPRNCSKKFCSYIRQTMNAMGKGGKFAYWTSSTYCDGI